MSHIKPKLYFSKTYNPGKNLGYEEWMMANIEEDEVVFFLWQNEKTIVIGRNQNPWKECRLDIMKEDGIRLVRRISGGGAVYHDLGNLNFTFIAHEKNYDLEKQLNVIIQALAKFGVHAEFSGRNDITVDGQKFSGNAFVKENGVCMQHGTLLIDVDMASLGQYLSVSPLKIKSKGIDSVKSRVVNLSTLSTEINIESMKEKLMESFAALYGMSEEVHFFTNEGENDMHKYDKWEWNFSEAPDFDVSIEEKYDWGIIDLNFKVVDGIITDCAVFTDSISIEGFQELSEILLGGEFTNQYILGKLEQSVMEDNIKKDIVDLILKRVV